MDPIKEALSECNRTYSTELAMLDRFGAYCFQGPVKSRTLIKVVSLILHEAMIIIRE